MVPLVTDESAEGLSWHDLQTRPSEEAQPRRGVENLPHALRIVRMIRCHVPAPSRIGHRGEVGRQRAARLHKRFSQRFAGGHLGDDAPATRIVVAQQCKEVKGELRLCCRQCDLHLRCCCAVIEQVECEDRIVPDEVHACGRTTPDDAVAELCRVQDCKGAICHRHQHLTLGVPHLCQLVSTGRVEGIEVHLDSTAHAVCCPALARTCPGNCLPSKRCKWSGEARAHSKDPNEAKLSGTE
mmetsp:Transcript_21987/g.58741  ORF Transcript_21987/g.58741 Transcript_21987/m.58741 type:complete len:240 (+) Transcript_21987:541-1260(+)